MREDDDQIGHFVPLLRRIIILLAVITAVPVILWTITVFVRSYVAPPKLPIFHHLAATESSEAPTNATAGTSAQPQPATEQNKFPVSSPAATVEARATATDARDLPAAMQMQMTDGSPAAAPSPKAPDMPAAPPPPEAAETSTGALAAQQTAAASEPPAEALPAAAPLSGPIPLPRRRPHVAEAAMTQIAQTNVPIPRPRPDGATPAAQPETGAQPLEFLQNIFH